MDQKMEIRLIEIKSVQVNFTKKGIQNIPIIINNNCRYIKLPNYNIKHQATTGMSGENEKNLEQDIKNVVADWKKLRSLSLHLIIRVIQRFHHEVRRYIVGIAWKVRNVDLHRDLVLKLVIKSKFLLH